MQLSICEMFTHIHWSNITIILVILQSYHIHSNNYVTNTPSNHDLNLKIPTASENTKRISENTHRIYLKMAKCRLTRLAWSGTTEPGFPRAYDINKYTGFLPNYIQLTELPSRAFPEHMTFIMTPGFSRNMHNYPHQVSSEVLLIPQSSTQRFTYYMYIRTITDRFLVLANYYIWHIIAQ